METPDGTDAQAQWVAGRGEAEEVCGSGPREGKSPHVEAFLRVRT